MAAQAVEFLLRHASDNTRKRSDGVVYTIQDETIALVGLVQRNISCTPVKQLRQEACFEYRLPRNQWWLSLRPLLRILARHQSIYEKEAIDQNGSE